MQNIPIEDSLLEKLHKFNYINHLSYIYIFAYDNGRQSIEKVYRSEDELVYYQKGVALARQINNYSLLSAAYVKNHMTAATEGMYEIAIYFINKTYELEKEIALPLDARILSAIGYNLSALSHNEKANLYYEKAIQVFYQDRKPEEIAEVYYNRGMNQIMIGKYKAAEHDFQMALKIIEYLHLNSLRVCNLSKLYGLLALCCILEGERFNCERYLTNCRQFLNYVMERERKREAEKTEMIHDYTKCDDDRFVSFCHRSFTYAQSGE